MGFLELVRRELDRIFVNDTPTFTYKLEHRRQRRDHRQLTPSTPTAPTSPTPLPRLLRVTCSSIPTAPSPSRPMRITTRTGASFDVTISDESSGFHIHGLSGLLNLVTFGLIGESGHTHTETIAVSGVVPPPDFQRTVVVSGLTDTDRLPLPASCERRTPRSHPHRREGRGDQGIQRQRNAESAGDHAPHADGMGTRGERYRGGPGLQ